MTDVDVSTAVRIAAEDYDWTKIHGSPGFEVYAKDRVEVEVLYSPRGQIAKIEKFLYPKGTDVAHTYLHGKLVDGRLVSTQYKLVPALRIFEGSL